jgi:membrane protein implicated in regulation of membrane protease activity
MEALQWWNLIFLLPAVGALIYLLVLALGAIPLEGHDVDVGHHLDAGHHDVEHGDGDPFHGALSLIGVGRVPLSLVLMSFAFLWGFFGWLGNRLFSMVLPSPSLFLWPSLVMAFLGAAVLTGVLARGLGRMMPSTESYGATARDLIGGMGDVRYALTAQNGSVQVHDRYGTLHEVPARVLPGEPMIPAGTRVVLWRFDDEAGAYLALQDDAINGPSSVATR